MVEDAAYQALREAFAGDDVASASWTQTAPDVKARCVEFVAAAGSPAELATRARDIHRMAAAGPIGEIGPGLPELPSYLRYAGPSL